MPLSFSPPFYHYFFSLSCLVVAFTSIFEMFPFSLFFRNPKTEADPQGLNGNESSQAVDSMMVSSEIGKSKNKTAEVCFVFSVGVL